jgi:chromate transporter
MSNPAATKPTQRAAGHDVSLGEALRVWTRVALISFGGPAAQIAVMHRIVVDEKRWISEQRFLHALNYCMLLPGPEAQQLATYIGWLMHRTLGGLVAGGFFVVPGIISIMALSYVYAAYGNVPVVVSLFIGLKAAVLAIVLEAVSRIGKRALKNRVLVAIAALAFIAIFFFSVPFPIIVLAAALIGFAGERIGMAAFQGRRGTRAGRQQGRRSGCRQRARRRGAGTHAPDRRPLCAHRGDVACDLVRSSRGTRPCLWDRQRL